MDNGNVVVVVMSNITSTDVILSLDVLDYRKKNLKKKYQKFDLIK